MATPGTNATLREKKSLERHKRIESRDQQRQDMLFQVVDVDSQLRQVALRKEDQRDDGRGPEVKGEGEPQAQSTWKLRFLQFCAGTACAASWVAKGSFCIVVLFIVLSLFFDWSKSIKLIMSTLSCLMTVPGSCSTVARTLFPDSASQDSYQLLIKITDPARNVSSSVIFETQIPILFRNPLVLGFLLLIMVVLNICCIFQHAHFTNLVNNLTNPARFDDVDPQLDQTRAAKPQHKRSKH